MEALVKNVSIPEDVNIETSTTSISMDAPNVDIDNSP